MNEIQWYQSKVDWWVALILSLPPMASVLACIALVLDSKPFALAWGIGSILFVSAIYFGLVFPMRYGLNETHLIVRHGICRQRIPFEDILEVYPSHNPLSSPALSLDRLHVQFGQGWFKAVMISPADRSGFLDDLARKAGLRREGRRFVR